MNVTRWHFVFFKGHRNERVTLERGQAAHQEPCLPTGPQLLQETQRDGKLSPKRTWPGSFPLSCPDSAKVTTPCLSLSRRQGLHLNLHSPSSDCFPVLGRESNVVTHWSFPPFPWFWRFAGLPKLQQELEMHPFACLTAGWGLLKLQVQEPCSYPVRAASVV